STTSSTSPPAAAPPEPQPRDGRRAGPPLRPPGAAASATGPPGATPLHSPDPIRQRAISEERVGASGRGPLRGRMVAARRQPLHRRACAPRRYVTYVSTSASRPPRSCDRATPKLTSGRQWLD